MKKQNTNLYILLISIILFSNLKIVSASDYSLKVDNITQIDSNTIEFDIFLKNTNSPTNVLRYFGCQYILKFNPAFGNGGKVSIKKATGDTSVISDLPVAYWPIASMVNGNELWISSNALPPEAVTPVISPDGNGTKIIRMRMHTTASSFSGSPELRWKNKQSAGFATNLGLYVNGTLTKVTDSLAHSVVLTSSSTVSITMGIQGLLNTVDNTLNSKESVKVFLRSTGSPFAIVDSAQAVIDSVTLKGNFIFSNAVQGNSYYIELKHKNSLQTWSADPVLLTASSTDYDFTTASSKAFGDNMILSGNKWCIFSGDVDQNGNIDLSDIIQIYNDAKNFTTGITDLNADHVTDLSDILISFNNSANFVQIVLP